MVLTTGAVGAVPLYPPRHAERRETVKQNEAVTTYRCECGKCHRIVFVRSRKQRPTQADIMPKGWRVYVPRTSLKVEYRCQGCPNG
jgi:hypothetical protein